MTQLFWFVLVLGEGQNPLLVDLQNASQQLDDANESITKYGEQASSRKMIIKDVYI